VRTCLLETNDHLFGISENQLESLNLKEKKSQRTGLDKSKKEEGKKKR